MDSLSFTTVYDGLSDVLQNDVVIEPAIQNELSHTNFKCRATWDTGAQRTVITPRVVKALQLLPVSIGKAHTPSGEYDAPIGTLILGILFLLFLLFYSLYDMFKSIFFGGSR